MVDHLAAWTPTGQFDEGATSRLVVVQKGMDRRMPFEERERLRQVDHRVQHRGVDPERCGVLHREAGEKVHEPLEDDYLVGLVVDGRYLFGRRASLEAFGPQLPASAVIPEANGEKAAAADLIAHLPTIRRCDPGHNAARCKVSEQGRMAQRCIREDTERRLGMRALCWHGISLADTGGQEADDTLGRVLQVFEGFAAAASLQAHDERGERAALTNPEVIPEILLVVHLEARRALLAQGREIHAVAVSFVPGQNAAAGKIFPDGDPGSIWGGSHFSVSLLRNPRKTQ